MELTLAQLSEAGDEVFPGHVGVRVESVEDGVVHARLELRKEHMAPNGYVHAGAVVTLADSACGYGCFLTLPEGGIGFTTIELKTNFVRSAQQGEITCEARLLHGGRTTQVWDAAVRDAEGRPMAHFRCTQLVLR